MSSLGFGTASLHHLPFRSQRQRLLEMAIDHGVTHFDTSPYYGFGLAERELGRLLVNRRADLTISTKAGLFPRLPGAKTGAGAWSRKFATKAFPPLGTPTVNWSLSRLRQSFRNSLEALKTDYVDFLFLHEPTYPQSDAVAEWLYEEKEAGHIRSWGLAGLSTSVSRFVQFNSPLANVIQTNDSLDRNDADFMFEAGRSLQFTYGYLSSQTANKNGRQVLHCALERNKKGCVLFSTRKPARIAELAAALSNT